eukprot:Ihof_evm11s68 gene=Ihof_evmTU11s68
MINPHEGTTAGLGPDIDYQQTLTIPHQQLLYTINQFVIHTVGFLNQFSGTCERKLTDCSYRLQKLETFMTLLEAKLDSLPDPPDISTASHLPPHSPTVEGNNIVSNQVEIPSLSPPESINKTELNAETTLTPTPTYSQDITYMKYFKMLRVGVSSTQVKMKMTLDGIDPSIL